MEVSRYLDEPAIGCYGFGSDHLLPQVAVGK